MEETSLINNLSMMVLGIIDAGCIARIVYCNVMAQTSDETRHSMKKRIKHILIFMIIANSIFGIRAAAQVYWG